MRKAYEKLSIISNGFKAVYAETKMTFQLQRSGRALNRREHEHIRLNKEALSKLGVFFVLQLPPVIGLIPIAVALTFPNIVLTDHFWSEEQRFNFTTQDFLRERLHAAMLLKEAAGYPGDISKYATWSSIVREPPYSKLILDPQFVHHMSISHSMVRPSFLSNLAPLAWHQEWLVQRTRDLIKDDNLLIKEGTSDLSTKELQLAVWRRGYDQWRDESDLRRSLDYWLAEQITSKERAELLEETTVPSRITPSTMAFMLLTAQNKVGLRRKALVEE